MKKFKFYAKIKNCELIFNEKMPPGVVAMQEVTFRPTEDAIKKPDNIWLAKAIKEHMEKMMDECFQIQVERVNDSDDEISG